MIPNWLPLDIYFFGKRAGADLDFNIKMSVSLHSPDFPLRRLIPKTSWPRNFHGIGCFVKVNEKKNLIFPCRCVLLVDGHFHNEISKCVLNNLLCDEK